MKNLLKLLAVFFTPNPHTDFDRGYVWALHEYLKGTSPIEISSYISVVGRTGFDCGIDYFLTKYDLYRNIDYFFTQH